MSHIHSHIPIQLPCDDIVVHVKRIDAVLSCDIANDDTETVAESANTEESETLQTIRMKTTAPSNIVERRVTLRDLHPEERGNVFLRNSRTNTNKITHLDIFCHFWNDEIVDQIVDYSNRSINEFNTTLHSNGKWKHGSCACITNSDFYHFCGVLLAMACYPLEKEHQYWNKLPYESPNDQLNTVAQRLIQQCMTLQKFRDLRIHMKFGTSEVEHDPRRLDWLCNSVFSRWPGVYKPENHLSLDDQSFRFYGRFIERQSRRKSKSDSSAIPLVSLNTPSGFTIGIRFMHKHDGRVISTQQMNKVGNELDDEVNSPSRKQLAIDLIRSFLPDPRGFYIYSDSYFTQYDLVRELADMGVLFTGTIRSSWLTHSSPELHLSKKQRRQLEKGKCCIYISKTYD